MQPHTRVQDCSCDTTESQEDQAPTTARYGEAQRRNEQDRQDLEDMAFNGLGQEMEEINMSMASSIPTQIGAGYVLDTPLVVLLHRGMRSSTAIGDIWVFVSLINAGPDIPAGGSEDVLNGQRADNAHPILGYCSMRDDAFAYASFSNLSISRSGRYRLCITAIDMRDQSYVLPAIMSDAFEVVDPISNVPQDVNTDVLHYLSIADLRAG